MELKEYGINLEQLIERAKHIEMMKVIVPAALEFKADIDDRIRKKQESTEGDNLPRYSEKEAWYTKKQFVQQSAFQAIGKRGKPTKSTMYFEHGYKQLRDVQGRQSDRWDLDYSGTLFKDFELIRGDKEVVIGFATERSADIRHSLEQRLGGEIFSGSNKEIDDYMIRVTAALPDIDPLITDL